MIISTFALWGCGEAAEEGAASGSEAQADAGEEDGDAGAGSVEDGGSGEDGGSAGGFAGSCSYTNTFSDAPECKLYTGAGWDEAAARQDCSNVLGAVGELTPGGTCGFEAELGRCTVEEATGKDYLLVISGDDPASCGAATTACEVFVRGTFAPSPTCEGDTPPVDPTQGGVFTPPYLDCRPPREGEPPGQSDGQVCTQVSIQGCTEPGRRFEEYASCDVVFTQRPYYGFNYPANFADSSARLADPEFAAEVEWSREQVAASACVCCHSTEVSPRGPSGWYLEAPVWTDTVPDAGLAMLAGWVDSASFGAFPPEENNGFDRHTTGLPTTDIPRMQAFLESLLRERGVTREDAAAFTSFGGPIYTQSIFEPSACAGEEGVRASGEVVWTGGGARYVYVLEAGSDNPGVPPNLDSPAGTRWRLDVLPEDEPVQSGLRYGEPAPGAVQRIPAEGAAPALVSGQRYYLYVLRDIGVPITRCLFTAP